MVDHIFEIPRLEVFGVERLAVIQQNHVYEIIPHSSNKV